MIRRGGQNQPSAIYFKISVTSGSKIPVCFGSNTFREDSGKTFAKTDFNIRIEAQK
jgi:hypothetical protein